MNHIFPIYFMGDDNISKTLNQSKEKRAIKSTPPMWSRQIENGDIHGKQTDNWFVIKDFKSPRYSS